MRHLKPFGEFKLDVLLENAQFGSKSAIFVTCDLNICWMTFKNNRAPILCYIQICASFQSHRWIQNGVTVRKRSTRVKISDLLTRVTLKNDRAPLLCCFKLYVSFHSHRWIKTKVSPETLNLGQNRGLFCTCDLEFWQMTLKNNRAPVRSNIQRYASFHHRMWIQTGVTVRKPLRWVMTSVTLTLDLWPWPFAYTSRLSLATHEISVMIRWQEHSEKVWQTDRQTDKQTDRRIFRAAWSQLKIRPWFCGSRDGNIFATS